MICDLLKLDASKLPATVPHDRNEQFYNAAGDSAIKPATKRRILNEFLNHLPPTASIFFPGPTYGTENTGVS